MKRIDRIVSAAKAAKTLCSMCSLWRMAPPRLCVSAWTLAILQAVASAAALPLPPLEWKLSGAARMEGGALVVDAPPEAPGGGATTRLDLRPFRNKSFRLTVRASMEGVPRPKFSYEGLKFQFTIYDRLIRRRAYVETVPQRFGDMAETTLELRYDAAVHDADETTLFLGLQNASGRVRFDLSTLAVEEVPSAFTITNQDWRCAYSDAGGSGAFPVVVRYGASCPRAAT